MPITLSGKKYVLNKQVYKYAIMLFFSNKISIVSFVFTGYGFFTMCTLCAFSITRLLNARLPLAGFNNKTKHRVSGVLHCAEESCAR